MWFQNNNQDKAQEIDLNPGAILEKIDSWLDGFVRLLPNLGVAIVVLVIFYFVAKGVGKLVKSRASRRERDNLGTVLGGFIKWAILITGALLAMTIVVPSIKPGDLIAGLGVSSVAIGFAFKDILQNWLAGLLILLRQPFEVGDQIKVNGFEGTVVRIETRATIIKTYDGERVVVPNSDIYTNAVQVKTAHELRRSQYDVGIGYADDMDEAKAELEKAVESIEGVDKEKGVEVFHWDLAASWVTMRVRWWTDSQQSSVLKTRTKVIRAIKYAMDDAKIDMPYDTKVHLFHDQTEETDGDRDAQREGWPAPKEAKEKPRSKFQAELEEKRAEKKKSKESKNATEKKETQDEE